MVKIRSQTRFSWIKDCLNAIQLPLSIPVLNILSFLIHNPDNVFTTRRTALVTSTFPCCAHTHTPSHTWLSPCNASKNQQWGLCSFLLSLYSTTGRTHIYPNVLKKIFSAGLLQKYSQQELRILFQFMSSLTALPSPTSAIPVPVTSSLPWVVNVHKNEIQAVEM